MQKKLIFLALTGLLCLSLAGCGQSGSTSPEGGSSPQAEQPAEETAGEDGGRTPERTVWIRKRPSIQIIFP